MALSSAPIDMKAVAMFESTKPLWLTIDVPRRRIHSMMMKMLEHGDPGEFIIRATSSGVLGEYKAAIKMAAAATVTYLIQTHQVPVAPGAPAGTLPQSSRWSRNKNSST